MESFWGMGVWGKETFSQKAAPINICGFFTGGRKSLTSPVRLPQRAFSRLIQGQCRSRIPALPGSDW